MSFTGTHTNKLHCRILRQGITSLWIIVTLSCLIGLSVQSIINPCVIIKKSVSVNMLQDIKEIMRRKTELKFDGTISYTPRNFVKVSVTFGMSNLVNSHGKRNYFLLSLIFSYFLSPVRNNLIKRFLHLFQQYQLPGFQVAARLKPAEIYSTGKIPRIKRDFVMPCRHYCVCQIGNLPA